MDPRLEFGAFNIKSGYIASSSDIANSFAGADDEDHHDRQHQGSVKGELEGFNPDKGADGSRVDARVVKVATSCGNDAPSQQSKDHACRFHDWRTKALAEQDRHKHQESEPNVFGASPRKCVRSSFLWTNLERTAIWARSAETCTTSPILEARFDQRNTDEDDSRTCDNWWENLAENVWRQEGEGDFNQGTESTGANECTIGIGTRKAISICIQLTLSVGVHLGKCASGDGNNGERRADDRNQSSANVIWRAPDVEPGDLDG